MSSIPLSRDILVIYEKEVLQLIKHISKGSRKLLKELFCENDKLSMTLLLAFMGYFIFAVGSLYLLWNNIDWAGYVVFASYTGGGGAALQFGNKLINSRYNSIAGGYDERRIENNNTSQQYNRNPMNSFTERK